MIGSNLELFVGAMFCGKSRELVKAYREAEKKNIEVVAFKPSSDKDRYGSGSKIKSKDDGYEVPAILIDQNMPDQILQYVEYNPLKKMVVIDEGSFYPKQEFIDLITSLTDRGIKVVVGGLTHFATREPWGAMTELAQVKGVKVTQLYSRCDGESGECKNGAVWSYRKIEEHANFVVGSEELYGACCDQHYINLHKGNIWEG